MRVLTREAIHSTFSYRRDIYTDMEGTASPAPGCSVESARAQFSFVVKDNPSIKNAQLNTKAAKAAEKKHKQQKQQQNNNIHILIVLYSLTIRARGASKPIALSLPLQNEKNTLA